MPEERWNGWPKNTSKRIQNYREGVDLLFVDVPPAKHATAPRQSRLSRARKLFSPASPATTEPQIERRSNCRRGMRFDAVIHPTDGTASTWKVRGIDIDDAGAQVVATHPITPGSVVYFYVPSFKQMGFAFVRHCASIDESAEKYRIGLQFRGRLMDFELGTWRISLAKESNNG